AGRQALLDFFFDGRRRLALDLHGADEREVDGPVRCDLVVRRERRLAVDAHVEEVPGANGGVGRHGRPRRPVGSLDGPIRPPDREHEKGERRAHAHHRAPSLSRTSCHMYAPRSIWPLLTPRTKKSVESPWYV